MLPAFFTIKKSLCCFLEFLIHICNKDICVCVCLLSEQDRGLDALSNVIGRQKQMALDIGNEVDDQNSESLYSSISLLPDLSLPICLSLFLIRTLCHCSQSHTHTPSVRPHPFLQILTRFLLMPVKP